MVLCFRCSSINLRASSISAWVRGNNLPGSVSGAPGSSLIAWSHTVCLGRRCDSCSEKILVCLWYSGGMGGFSAVSAALMVTFPIKYRVVSMAQGLFTDRGTKWARFVLFALRIIGNWDASIHPRFQSILGCTAANQEYPSMALFSPKSVRKNRSFDWFGPVCTSKSVKYLSLPLLLVVLSTLNILHSCWRVWIGSFNHLA